MVYRILLKAIQKMQNSLALRQQHFLHQRKTCTTRYLHEVPQASRYQMISAGNFSEVSRYPAPDFIRDSAERERCPHVKLKKSSEYKEIGYRNICSISGLRSRFGIRFLIYIRAYLLFHIKTKNTPTKQCFAGV